MRKWIIFLLLGIFIYACSRVPVTNRKQVNLLPESMLLDMSFDQYNQFLQQSNVVQNTAAATELQNIGQKIANASEQYLKKRNKFDRVDDFQWEFKLIEEDVANAFALPGGKVAFYTGMLDIAQTDGGIATVLGHEIAHAIARHGNERMSQQLGLQLGGMALDVALSDRPEQTRNIFLTAYGVGANLGVILPFSRLHESEADQMGMIFMAMAGYNPQEAIDFWQRMDAASSGQEPPEFLSTHPNHDTRVQKLQEFLPEAMKYYEVYGMN